MGLGRSGLRTTVLGIGTGTHSGNQQRALGQNGFTKLVRHALERGVRFVDTADSYVMHLLVRFALEESPATNTSSRPRPGPSILKWPRPTSSVSAAR